MYNFIKNNNLTNSLTKTQGKSIVKECDQMRLVQHKFEYPSGTLTIKAPYGVFDNLDNATHKFFDILTLRATAENNKTIVVSINDFMQLRNLVDRQKAKKQAKEALNLLNNAEIEFTDKKGTYGFFRIVQSGEVNKKSIKVMFGDTFFEMIKSAPKMPYPLSLLAFNDKHSSLTYTLVRKLTELVNMGTDAIRTSSLLAYTTLPKVEDVKHGKYKEKIITPFTKALNKATPAILAEWHYVDDNNKTVQPNTIEEFLDAKIAFKFADYDYQERNKRRASYTKKSKPKAVK